jgi:hypothetical protein
VTNIKNVTTFGQGHAVAQLVEALRYKGEGRGFDSRKCHWKFSFPRSFRPHYGPGVDSASNRNEYQEHFLRGKGGRCVGLTTLGASTSWNPLGLSRPVMGLLYHYNYWHRGAIFMELFLEQRNAFQHADLGTASSWCSMLHRHYTLHTSDTSSGRDFSDHKDLYRYSVYIVRTEHKQLWTYACSQSLSLRYHDTVIFMVLYFCIF